MNAWMRCPLNQRLDLHFFLASGLLIRSDTTGYTNQGLKFKPLPPVPEVYLDDMRISETVSYGEPVADPSRSSIIQKN